MSSSMTESHPQKNDQPGGMSNLTTRVLTASVLIPVVLIGLWVGDWLWALMMIPIALIGTLEFFSLAHDRPRQGIALVGMAAALGVLLGFYLQEPVIWALAPVAGTVLALLIGMALHRDLPRAFSQGITTLLGVLYVAFPAGFLIAVRGLEDGRVWLAMILVVTWSTDTMAYFGGRKWGRHKLAPRLSPKKTVEGAVAGVFGGIIPATLILVLGDVWSVEAQIMIVLSPFVAIAGDLLESAIKRYYDVKDSHLAGFNIVPGHGGVLDRVDSLLLVSTFSYIYILVTGIAS